MRAFTLNFKKIVSAFMAIVIMCICTCDFSVNTKATNTGRTYQVFDVESSSYLCTYSLTALESVNNISTFSVSDDRVEEWSKSGVVKLISTNGGIGSGFVVDDHVIATAAHCVYNYDSGIQKASRVLLFNSEDSEPIEATPVEVHVPNAFIDANIMPNDIYQNISDYALITVKEDLSDYMCFNLGVALNTIVQANPVATITGFPVGVNNLLVNTDYMHNKYSGNGTITEVLSEKLYHNIDTSGGNSGGPLYITETRSDKTYYTVIGIHVQGGNCATRITTDQLHFYYNNPYLNWE